MSKNRRIPLPSGRVNRMLRLGRLATGVAGSALTGAASQLARGRMPAASEVFLSPANARRVTTELAQMRGAVMKIGQLLSMEAGDLLPRELTGILAELRAGAYSMPPEQLHGVLEREWGAQWQRYFDCFDTAPLAAASIGQVHAARQRDGRRLAVKIQYPGVADSIDSDVDNVGKLLRLFRLAPPGLEIEPLLDLARRQLHEEADYRLEANNLLRYRERLGDDPVFRVPELVDALSGAKVLAMSYVDGNAIENLATENAALRDRMGAQLIELTLREFLHWGLVQSDANFANFVYDAASRKIGLLDFGALRVFDRHRMAAFARLLRAATDDDLAAIVDTAIEVGYLAPSDPFSFRLALADLLRLAAEPARHAGSYDFGNSTLVKRLGERLYRLRHSEEFQRIPPQDVLFLHRRLAGIYLLCARIHARVDLRASIDRVLAESSAMPEAAQAAG